MVAALIQLMTNRIEKAVAAHGEGLNCAQAIVATYGPDFGLSRETALKISSSFGGGMGRLGYTCGAISGSLMILGLIYGYADAKDSETKRRVYEMVREFIDLFKEKWKSTECRELLRAEIHTKNGYKQACEKGLFRRCDRYVQTAAEILEEMLPSGRRVHPS